VSTINTHLVIDITSQEDDSLAQEVVEQVKRHLQHSTARHSTAQHSTAQHGTGKAWGLSTHRNSKLARLLPATPRTQTAGAPAPNLLLLHFYRMLHVCLLSMQSKQQQ
jgi:hypothetical protein